MTWKFDPAAVKAVDLKEAKAGDFLCPLRSGSSGELWLRLAGEAGSAPMVTLTGQRALEVWNVKPQGDLPTLVVAQGPHLQLEIPTSGGEPGSGGRPGDLLIADSGAYLVAVTRAHGFSDECYISLATWSVADSGVRGRASFSTWRLVDARDPADKRVVLSFGDWSAVTR